MLSVGLAFLGAIGLWWIARLAMGPMMPARMMVSDPRTPGDFHARLELQTPAGPLPVLIERYFFLDDDRDEDRLFVGDFRRMDLGEYTAYWRYDLRTHEGVSGGGSSIAMTSRSEPISEKPGHHRLILRFEPSGSELVAEYAGHELQPLSTVLASGVWRRPDGEANVPFQSSGATGNTPLYDRTDQPVRASDFAGRWRVLAGDPAKPMTVTLRVGQYTGEASGSFQTDRGEARTLVGRVDGDMLRLSFFDGGVAVLVHARLQADGTLVGEWWDADRELVSWTGVRDERSRGPRMP